ncbi:unnamed protein product [Didymodactylos carnosus]|uniref:Uncharacterized protein n=2 Tax=Didymodactylos carnosus TaxID=1234261 RepID=A0A813PZC8_9BILA|nr:unnamed protein product [Didymodactylos carnosus]CAF3539372.1 unnamed protein product [Didymodactylos carnosus]
MRLLRSLTGKTNSDDVLRRRSRTTAEVPTIIVTPPTLSIPFSNQESEKIQSRGKKLITASQAQRRRSITEFVI